MQISKSNNKYNLIETYSIFSNVDESILKLNKLIEPFGYKFIAIAPFEIERRFYDLLFLSPNNLENTEKKVKSGDSFVSVEFFQAFTSHPIFGHSNFVDGSVILLKQIDDVKQSNEGEYVDIDGITKATGKFQTFKNSLIEQLKLFKNGDISSILQFQINKETRKVVTRLGGNYSKLHSYKSLTLNDNEVAVFSNSFQEKLAINDLSELALSSFLLSYNIPDRRNRYLTLITSLESLFNQGRDQITHIVSRHLALIVSESIQDFELNYRRMKKLYGIRSTISHGHVSKDNIDELIDELQNLARKAINYCLAQNINKKELFDKLNRSGVELIK